MANRADLLLYGIEVLFENVQIIYFHYFFIDLGGLRGPSK